MALGFVVVSYRSQGEGLRFGVKGFVLLSGVAIPLITQYPQNFTSNI